MKKNQFRFIKILVCSSFIFFCFENILSAQTTRRKPAAKRSTARSVNEQTSQTGATGIVSPKLQPDAQVAVLETDYGKIVIELYPKLAPQMVERFKKLIKEGFYDGTTFHRISPPLGIIQGGDPNSKDKNPQNDGYGNSHYPNVPAEFSEVPYERGIVGAARASDLNSANCQFFIMLKRQAAFDNKYTIFGRVIEGLASAYIISISPTDRSTERPEDPVIVKRSSLQLRKLFKANN